MSKFIQSYKRIKAKFFGTPIPIEPPMPSYSGIDNMALQAVYISKRLDSMGQYSEPDYWKIQIDAFAIKFSMNPETARFTNDLRNKLKALRKK
ncbi:MAG TPA: hypothetical protein VK625_11125 [Flavitalea sp.]|nr:hypothetical protein [Flavitalea sp.]